MDGSFRIFAFEESHGEGSKFAGVTSHLKPKDIFLDMRAYVQEDLDVVVGRSDRNGQDECGGDT